MSYRSIFLRLALIFSETCFLVLLYYCVAGASQGRYLLNPVLFFFLATVLILGNFIISWQSLPRIAIVIINLVLITLVSLILLWQTDFRLASIPAEILPACNVILVDCTILWLIFRSLYLAYKKSIDTVYGHFDLYIILSFLVLLIMGFAHITLPGGMTWVLSALFFNLLTLYISSNSGVNANPLSGWILAAITIMLIYLSSESVAFLPKVAGPAGNIYDLMQNIFLYVLRIIGNIIVAFFGLLWGRSRIQPESEQGLRGNNENITTQTSDWPWLDTVMHWLLIFLAIVLAIVILQVLYQLLRFLVAFLLKRNKQTSPEKITINLILPWQNLYRFIKNGIKQIRFFMLPFLPVKTTVYSAYRQLLWWGSWKKCPRLHYETPYGYYERLSGKYPNLAGELYNITSLYVVYRYSLNFESDQAIINLKPLLRKIYISDFCRLVESIRRIFRRY